MSPHTNHRRESNQRENVLQAKLHKHSQVSRETPRKRIPYLSKDAFQDLLKMIRKSLHDITWDILIHELLLRGSTEKYNILSQHSWLCPFLRSWKTQWDSARIALVVVLPIGLPRRPHVRLKTENNRQLPESFLKEKYQKSSFDGTCLQYTNYYNIIYLPNCNLNY